SQVPFAQLFGLAGRTASGAVRAVLQASRLRALLLLRTKRLLGLQDQRDRLLRIRLRGGPCLLERRGLLAQDRHVLVVSGLLVARRADRLKLRDRLAEQRRHLVDVVRQLGGRSRLRDRVDLLVVGLADAVCLSGVIRSAAADERDGSRDRDQGGAGE